jgi:hypothetical protein
LRSLVGSIYSLYIRGEEYVSIGELGTCTGARGVSEALLMSEEAEACSFLPLQVAWVCVIDMGHNILERLPSYFALHLNVQLNDLSPATPEIGSKTFPRGCLSAKSNIIQPNQILFSQML